MISDSRLNLKIKNQTNANINVIYIDLACIANWIIQSI